MNLHNNVRQSYGQSKVKEIRDFENCEKKIQRHRNHLVYTLRCRDLDLTPSSLQLRSPINTKRAQDIINRAQKSLVKERIRVINNKLGNLKNKREELDKKVNQNIPAESPIRKQIKDHIATVKESTYAEVKSRHVLKLKKLAEKTDAKRKKTADSTPDLSGTQLKKWVVNLSKYKLNSAQTSVLAKGLNYAIAPQNVCAEEFVLATEMACKHLPQSESTQLRAKIASVLKSSKPPKTNVTKAEREAISVLKKEADIVILPADKGKATCILDRENYEEKVNAMLSDKKTYGEIKDDPTPKYKRKLVAILSKLKKDGKISEAKYKSLYSTAENIPRLYCTPKIHKANNPLRPIVDYTNTIGYSTSRWLADILSGLVGKTKHHVNNSQHLASELSELIIDVEDLLNSHDVVSLFTNTPIDQVLDIVKSRLEKEDVLKTYNKENDSNLTSDDVVQLLHFILTTTYFIFRGQIYRQLFGTAMGSPVSPIAANIFMEALEQQAIATAPMECKPKLWLRYVDDVLEVVHKECVDELTDHLNQIDKSGSIKFTYEKETDGKIPFLDTLIVKKEDGTVKLLVYRKPTHTDQYLNYGSHHPLHQKLGVIRTLYDRMNKVITEDEDKKVEEIHVQHALENCGYPKWTFDKVKDKMAAPKQPRDTKRTTETPNRGFVVIPYVKGVSERVARVMKKYHISSAMKPHCTLRSHLVNPKDKRDPLNTTLAIYDIP